MRIALERVTIGEGLGASVPELTATITGGVPNVLAVETAERPMLVSLLLGGRIRPDSGRVTVDGAEDLDALRVATALVDTPVVAEPTAGLSIASIIAEEFSFAGLPSSRRAVHRFLHRHGMADYARVPVRALPPLRRTRMFSELALLRPAVTALVITSPERHGGDPAEWYDALVDVAARGTTIAIVTDAATRDLLLRLGARDALAPVPEPAEPLELELPESPADDAASTDPASAPTEAIESRS
jgi:ABC-2 type transport system ATP-binding protein